MKPSAIGFSLVVASLGLSVLEVSAAEENCTGFSVLVVNHVESRDLGGGMKLTTFASDSAVISNYRNYNLLTGPCSGTEVTTPDGKVQRSGFCVRRDQDGHAQSVEVTLAPGAEKGTWRTTGGTGKFAGNVGSGWVQVVRVDGKQTVTKWGGHCSLEN